jgi:hypothetical protein
MSSRVHDGQLQVVEGSAVGHFFVVPRMEYGTCGSLIFLGESKTSCHESENRFYLQKFVYDSNYNLTTILVAQNLSTLGCTDVTLKILNGTVVEMVLNNGDFSEANVGDGINIKTFTQEFSGKIFKKLSDSKVHIETTSGTAGLLNETNSAINESDLIIRFEHEKTKFYTNRRWDHRNRYLYA